MLHESVTLQEAHDRFITRVAGSETVFCLRGPKGFANCPSNEQSDEHEDRDILLFFSDRAYAQRVADAQYPDYTPFELPLFDFLFRWLSGMHADNVLAGTNYTPDLAGLEIPPATLRNALLEALGPTRSQQYLSRLKSALSDQEP